MAKILLTIEANNTATESIKLLTKEVQKLASTLGRVKVNKDLTAQINALTRNFTALMNVQAKFTALANKQAAGIETTRKGYANLVSTLKTLKAQYASNVFGKLPEDVDRAFKKIEELSAAFEKNGRLTKTQQKILAQLSQQLKKYSADVASAKAKNDKIVSANPFTLTQAQQIPRLIKQYSTLLSHIKSIEKYYPKGTFDTFKKQLADGTTQLQGLNKEYQTTKTLTQGSQENLNNLANGFLQVSANVEKTTASLKSSKGSIADIVMGFAKFQLAATLVMKPLQWIRAALTSINETLVKTEDAVVALQRVLPNGSASDNEISSRLYGLAQQYGQTFENVSEIATNFARAGMDWNDTIKATEAAVLALNVAELDATEASDGMIAILKQFGLEASDLQLVVDKLNITADNAAVTTEKLLAALQRTGSAAKNARLSLDETLSVITAMSEATGRSGENLGAALNSLIQYSTKASALDTFAGLSKESADVVNQFRQGSANILDVWQQVSKEIQNLKSDQADLLDQYFASDDGEALKEALDGELQDIYTELGGVYDTANTFRKNYFIALLGNMGTVEKAMGTLTDASGYSQKENEKYLNTYTAKLNSLKAQWQDIANDEQGLLGIKKHLVDVASGFLTIVKWTGGLRTTLLAVSTVVWLLVGDRIISGIKSIGTAIKGLVAGLSAAKKAAQGVQAALGWIGIAATAISVIVGAFKQAVEEERKAEEERRSNAYSSTNDVNETAAAINGYIEKLNELKTAQAEGKDVTAELATIQDELKRKYEGVAEAIGKANGTLQNNIDLTSEAARQAAIQDALRWRLENEEAIQTATKNVTEGASAFSVRRNPNEKDLSNYNSIASALDKAGFGDYVKSGVGGGQHGEEFAVLSLSFDDFANKDEIIKKIEEINAYINEKGLGIGVTQEQFDLLKEMLSEVYNKVNSEAYKADKEIYEYNQKIEKLVNGGTLAEFLGIEQKVTTETAKQTNNIQDQISKYDTLIDKLKELRDVQKESLDLEKAKRELENAQNEATVRRYNEQTGQWEWQTDEKRIAEARENLEEKSYETIIDQLEKQTATNESILAIIKELAPLLGDDWANAVKGAFLETTGVDLDQPVKQQRDFFEVIRDGINWLGSKLTGNAGASHDKGGLALGKGVINKATDRPESVNNPDLTAKILSPVSNEHFDRYVRDMGLLFETSRQYAQSPPIIEHIGGATDNRVNNSGQVFIQGVNVGAERRNDLLDILNLAPLTSDN